MARQLDLKLTPVSLGLLLSALFAWAQFTDFPLISALKQRVESIAYDVRLNTTLAPEQEPDDRIVIVDVDEKSLATHGRWPWSRSKIAILTDKLFDAGAIVVGYDIFFSEPERNTAFEVLTRLDSDNPDSPKVMTALESLIPQFDHDSRLAESLRDRDTVLGYLFHDDQTTPVGQLPPPLRALDKEESNRSAIRSLPTYSANLPLLQQASASGGFVNSQCDPDGVVRRTPMVMKYGNEIYGSLSLNIAMLYLFLEEVEINTSVIEGQDNVEYIGLGELQIPTEGDGLTLIPYQGPAHSFRYISATDVLEGTVGPEQLENSIVIIGATAVGLGDLIATPVENIYPGVEVHANMVRAILDNDFPIEPTWAVGANFTTTIALGILLALILPFCGPVSQLILALIAAVGLTIFNFWLWQEKGLALALAWPLILIVALSSLNMSYGFLKERHKRGQLKNMFGQYIPPELVETMDSPDQYGFEGESREMTVLFADIRGFTTLSEQLSPSELRQLLNRYFTHMTEIIFKHQGTIDKYVGDMVMAFWGAPIRDPDHAQHAIDAALEMLEKTAELKPQLMAEGYPEIDIGIGLNTGLMNVGDMGSQFRRAYTVLGDNVNLGSRIEGLTKFYGAGLVVSETTKGNYPEMLFRYLDLVRVKGKTEGVKVYEPLLPIEKASPELMEELEQHEKGINHYLNQRWDKAERIFTGLRNHHPKTRAYQLYLNRISELRLLTLPRNWDGVYERNEK